MQRNFKHVKQLLLKFRKLGQLPPVKKRQLSLSLLAKFYAAQVLISQLRLGSRSSRRVVAPSFPGLELRTWTARVLSELEGWLRRHSPLTTSGAGGPRPFCKITTQRINLLRLIQHFKNRKAKCDLRKWLKLTFVLLDHLGKSHLKSSFLAFQNLMTLWTFLISTECALMRPLTYDNHPSIPTQPSSPHIALKTTSRELKNALRCIRTHWDSVRCSDYMSWNTHFCLKNCGRAFFLKRSMSKKGMACFLCEAPLISIWYICDI